MVRDIRVAFICRNMVTRTIRVVIALLGEFSPHQSAAAWLYNVVYARQSSRLAGIPILRLESHVLSLASIL